MSTKRRKCVNDPDVFCYICGKYALPKRRGKITDFVEKAYLSYFGVKLGDQNKPWAPHSACKSCVEHLREWTNGKRKSGLSFGVPMVWREPSNHVNDCYFCMVHLAGVSSRTLSKVAYPNLPSAIRPIPHSDDLPVPVFQSFKNLRNEIPSGSSTEQDTDDDDAFTLCSEDPKKPRLFSQDELNDLVRDLGLPKMSAELLASRLSERNLLTAYTKVSFYRDREKSFLKFFSLEENFVFCHDVEGLLNALGCDYESSEWRLFIDSSKASLKCVLLSNGNQYASVPIRHSVLLKESYDAMKMVLTKIKYSEHNWKICGVLKMICILLEQNGFTKFPFFFCVYGIVELAKNVGLRRIGQREKSLK